MIVSLTPIRSGTKGFPNKNIRLLNGKPLFHHVVLEAKKVQALSEVWISTDSKHYASLAPPGVLVHARSKETAADSSTTADVVMEFIKPRPYIKTIVILQATSPTTNSKDIEEALQLSASGKGCVSVRQAHVYLYQDSKPLWKTRTPRQTSTTFAEDGGIFVIQVEDFLKTKTMPTFPCETMMFKHPVCDIDTEEDFKRASALLCGTDSTLMYVDATYVQLKSRNQNEKWETPTEENLNEFIQEKIMQLEENNICIITDGIISEEESHYVVSDVPELNPFWKDMIIPKVMNGTFVTVENDGDHAVTEFVRENNLHQRNVMLLVYGTAVATGLYVNGKVVKNADIRRLLDPEYLTNLEETNLHKTVKEIIKIKSMLSLDDVYISGTITARQYCLDIFKQNGIKIVHSSFK